MDPAAAFECVSDWLPDFIAFHRNPNHPLAADLYRRARNTVIESFAAGLDSDSDDQERTETAIEAWTTVVILDAVAQIIVSGEVTG